jgi:hypothetical protein
MLRSIPYFQILITFSVSVAVAPETVNTCTKDKIIEQFSCSESVLHCHQLTEENPIPVRNADSTLNNVLYSNPRKIPEQAKEEIDSILTVPPADLTLIEFRIDTSGLPSNFNVICSKDQSQAKWAQNFVENIQFTPAIIRGSRSFLF